MNFMMEYAHQIARNLLQEKNERTNEREKTQENHTLLLFYVTKFYGIFFFVEMPNLHRNACLMVA